MGTVVHNMVRLQYVVDPQEDPHRVVPQDHMATMDSLLMGLVLTDIKDLLVSLHIHHLPTMVLQHIFHQVDLVPLEDQATMLAAVRLLSNLRVMGEICI